MRWAALVLAAAVTAPRQAEFETIDIVIDTGGRPMAAYQFEVVCDAKLLGVEKADFDPRAPYHDPAALQGGRIVVAQYTLAEPAPSGKVRVAALHVQHDGKPDYKAKIIVVAGPEGERMDATIEVVRRGGN